MPWIEKTAMENRIQFLLTYKEGRYSLSELANQFNISRKTAYKWIKRCQSEGLVQLVKPRSTARKRPPESIQPHIAEVIIQLRKQYPTWGPKKLLSKLTRDHQDWKFPAISTVGLLLKKHGLIHKRRIKRRSGAIHAPLADVIGPNQVWSADFKGQFKLKSKETCYPLTVMDSYSRYLLGCQGLFNPNTEHCMRVFDQLFQEYGLPAIIRTDNGPPFSAQTMGGLTPLTVWLIKLNIKPERIRPSHPEENGRHERMHRTLKAETTKPPGQTMLQQQETFDQFRQYYNYERPHKADRKSVV